MDTPTAAPVARPDVRIPELFEPLPLAPFVAPGTPAMTARDTGLLELGIWLQHCGYHFTTPTPETHRRVIARMPEAEAQDVRDVFGWSRRFRAGLLPPAAVRWLDEAGALLTDEGWFRSRLRFSTLDGMLLAHSAWPTLAPDTVFFGPDTYRFAALIKRVLAADQDFAPHWVVDVGCGTGAGGLLAANRLGYPLGLILSDINPQALRLARVNARLAQVPAQCMPSDVLAGIGVAPDLVLANPPYLADPAGRLYRDGGGRLGSVLSQRIVAESLERLAPGGKLILYTGSAIVDGRDLLLESLVPLLEYSGAAWAYEELDPDVFGEELDQPNYAQVERVAAVGLVARVPG